MKEEEIRIIKTTQCPSLSERSTLTYEIGVKGDSLYVHLSGNSEKGLFCKEWIPMETIHQLLSSNETITSKSLKSLYSGRSVNSPGFLLSVLKHEGLIQNTDDKSRTHKRADPAAFNAAMKALIVGLAKPNKAKKSDMPTSQESSP